MKAWNTRVMKVKHSLNDYFCPWPQQRDESFWACIVGLRKLSSEHDFFFTLALRCKACFKAASSAASGNVGWGRQHPRARCPCHDTVSEKAGGISCVAPGDYVGILVTSCFCGIAD
uniref:Uncharacterized protein n=1 Tax=Glossina austeni TaxID=7395 RepID=A0A1A9VBX5_GLOAU